MLQLDRANLASITVFVGEKDFHDRQKLRDMFQAEGIKNVSTHANVSGLQPLLNEVPPDLLVLSDDFDPDVFNLVRKIRFNQLGLNPFIIVSMPIAQRSSANIQKAIRVGVDDIVIKPLDPTKVRERLRLITYHRQPFIATSDYIGPDRKGDVPLQPGAQRIDVLNTLKEKAEGRTFEQWELQEAIDKSQKKIVEAQLTNQSRKMGDLCDLVLDAYRSDLVTEDVRENLSALAGILREAGGMAKRIKDTSLEELCLSLVKNVEAMEKRYENPSKGELGLIEKIAQAFRMAIDSAAARKQQEEAEIAARYEGRIAGQAVDL